MPLCDLCQVDVPLGSHDAHQNGKKHQKMLQMYQARCNKADKTVFVRGFARGTSDLALRDYFSRFGPVADVFVDKKQGTFAFVEFNTKETRDQVLREKLPLFYGTKLMVKTKNVSFEPSKKREERNQTGQPETAARDGTPGAVSLEDMMAKLCTCQNLDNQMLLLMKEVQLTEDDIKLRQIVCSVFQDVLQWFFPGCRIDQFGSSANGFGMKGCDMDIFMNIDYTSPLDGSSSNIITIPSIADLPSLKHKNGRVTTQDLRELPPFEKLKVVSRVLGRCVQGITNLFTIPSSRCPVLRFVYSPCDLKCDLSVNNRLGFWNTKLLALYARYDERVPLFVYAVRYWAKHKDIAGNVSRGTRLSNYTLTLMSIFYLQNCTPPVAPSVEELRKYCGEGDIMKIDEWDCSFPLDSTKIPASTNTSSIGELFIGFLKFYADFDFRRSAISTLSGQATSVSELETINPNSEKKFTVGSISVQDPFVLSHNTASNVNEKSLNHITQMFATSHKMCCEETFCDRSNTWGLSKLLEEINPTDFSLSNLSAMDGECPFSFPLFLKADKLTPQFMKALGKNDLQQHWCSRVSDFVQTCLSEALCFQVDEQMLSSSSNEAEEESNKRRSDDLLSIGKRPRLTQEEVKAEHISDELRMGVDETSCVLSADNPRTESMSSEKGDCLVKEPKPSLPCSFTSDTASPEVQHGNTSKELESSVAQHGDDSKQDTTDSKQAPEIVKILNCCATKRTWVGRKNAHRAVVLKTKGLDSLDLEKQVSEHIMTMKGEQIDCCVMFRLHIFKVVSKASTSVTLNFQPPINAEKEFSCLFIFLKSFLPKMVNHYLS